MESNDSQPPREHADSPGDPSPPVPPNEQPEPPQAPASSSPVPAVAPFPFVPPDEHSDQQENSDQQGPGAQQPAQENGLDGAPGHIHQVLSSFWEIPGDDGFPHPPGVQPIDCAWAQTILETFNCRGRLFLVPLFVLNMSAHWIAILTTHVRPATGWPVHEVRPEIFAIVLHVATLSCSLEGIEPGINLCMIFSALWLAETWEMTEVVERLKISIYRYIIRRILHRNPHETDHHRVMGSNYFVFRATELYRAWQFTQYVDGMANVIRPVEIARLYYYTIPKAIWPALGDNHMLFLFQIHACADVHCITPKQGFRDYFVELFVRAGYLTNEWPSGVEPDNHHYLAYAALVQQGVLHNVLSQMMVETTNNTASAPPAAPGAPMTTDAPPAAASSTVPDAPAASDGPSPPEIRDPSNTAFTDAAPNNESTGLMGDQPPGPVERHFYYMTGKDMEELPPRLVDPAEYSTRLTAPLPAGPPPDAPSGSTPDEEEEELPEVRLPVLTGPVNTGADGAPIEVTEVTVQLPLNGNYAQDLRQAIDLADSAAIRDHLSGHVPLYTAAEVEEETAGPSEQPQLSEQLEPSEQPSGDDSAISTIADDFD